MLINSLLRKLYNILSSLVLLHCINAVHAQQVDTTTSFLQTIEVVAPLLKTVATGFHIQKIDSLVLQNYKSLNLADLLQNNSAVQINTYTPGGLSNVSLRGCNSNHTAILWNGLNLQSSASGQADLSLIPINSIDQVHIQYGGSTALFGSGAMGGIIHLNSLINCIQGSKANVAISKGSYGFDNYAAGVVVGKNCITSKINVFHSNATNNYHFINSALFESPRTQQTNAAYKNTGITVSELFKINANNSITLNAWQQQQYSELPPQMTNTLNLEHTTNQATRIALAYQHSENKNSIRVLNGLLRDHMLYENDMMQQSNINQAYTLINEIEGRFYLKQHHFIKAGINHTYEEAFSDYYGQAYHRQRASIAASYKYFRKKYQLLFNFRDEINNGYTLPQTYSAGFNFNLSKQLLLKGNISKNYRLPTFNELYWGAWGNPNLKPEQGISKEIGLLYQQIKPNMGYHISSTVYHSNLSNGIIWVPMGSTWSPENVTIISNTGIETVAEFKHKTNTHTYLVSASYTFNHSINNNPSDLNYLKQIIYTPKHIAQATLAITYKNWQCSVSQQLTDKRFIDRSNSLEVKSFTLGSLYLHYQITKRNTISNIFIRINNLYNEQYQMMAWYAMPLRTWQTGIQLNFNKTK